MDTELFDVWQCSNGLSNPPNHAPKRIACGLPLARARLIASSTSHDRLDRPCAVEQHDPSPVPTCPLFSAEGWVNGRAVFLNDGRVLPARS